MVYWGYMGMILYRANGKENGNDYARHLVASPGLLGLPRSNGLSTFFEQKHLL